MCERAYMCVARATRADSLIGPKSDRPLPTRSLQSRGQFTMGILSPHFPAGSTWRIGMLILCAVACSSGCGLAEWAKNGLKLGPNYKTPPASVAPQWIDYHDARVKSEPQEHLG